MWVSLSFASLMVILVVDIRCYNDLFGHFPLFNYLPENPYCNKEHECIIGNDTYLNTLCVYKTRPFRGDQQVPHDQPHGTVHRPEITEDFTDKMETTEKKEAILKFLNQWRSNVTKGLYPDHPNAGNMRQLSWDPILETMAVYWSKMGVRRTDKCRKVLGVFEQPAQMVFNSTVPKVTVGSRKFTDGLDIVKLIHDRAMNLKGDKVKELIKLFKWQDDIALNSWAAGLWAKSFKVGCADVHYKHTHWYATYHTEGNVKHKRKNHIEHYWTRAIFCNFGPGIVEGEPIYDNKPACGSCPSGTECRKDSVYPSLCALPTDPKDYTLGTRQGTCPFAMINLALVSLLIYSL